MDWLELLGPVIAIILSYGIGLIMNKPGYKKGKNIVATINKAFDDDKLTSDEVNEIIGLFKKHNV